MSEPKAWIPKLSQKQTEVFKSKRNILMNHKPKIQPPKPKPDVLVPVTGVGIAKHKHGIQVTMHTNDGWRCYVMDEDTAFLFAKALISFLPSVSGKRERAGTEKKSA